MSQPEGRPADLLEQHLTALAVCVVVQRGGALADLAEALGVSITAVREGVLHIAPRLEAVGLAAIVDSVDVPLAPAAGAAEAVHVLSNDDATRFSSPILLGEAGVHTDGAGRHYVPNRMLVLAEGGLGEL